MAPQKKSDRQRLDTIVQHAAGVSRSKAQGLILTGCVSTPAGVRLDKPGQRFPADTPVVIEEGPRYVSRGGEKLAAAIEAFKPELTGATAIDAGASTGGFTDCLLKHGAAKVYAVDVGYGQLAWELRQDPRVVVLERTNIRNLEPGELPERPDFFTADCSFISLALVLPALVRVCRPDASGIVLIKPQFEAGPEKVSRGGVVRNPEVHEEVVREVLQAAARCGLEPAGVVPSPLLGPAGNREFLAMLRPAPP